VALSTPNTVATIVHDPARVREPSLNKGLFCLSDFVLSWSDARGFTEPIFPGGHWMIGPKSCGACRPLRRERTDPNALDL
jgi:hypothetical protein